MGYAVKLQQEGFMPKMYFGVNNNIPRLLETLIKPYYVEFPWEEYTKSPLMDNALIITSFNVTTSSYFNAMVWVDAENTEHRPVTSVTNDWICLRNNQSTAPAANVNSATYLFLQTNKNIKNIRHNNNTAASNWMCFLFNSSLHYTLQLINPAASGNNRSYTFTENYDYCYLISGSYPTFTNNSMKVSWNNDRITFVNPFGTNDSSTSGIAGYFKEGVSSGDIVSYSATGWKMMIFAFSL